MRRANFNDSLHMGGCASRPRPPIYNARKAQQQSEMAEITVSLILAISSSGWGGAPARRDSPKHQNSVSKESSRGLRRDTTRSCLPSQRCQFTTYRWKKPDGERFLQALNGRFLCFAPISYVSPQKSSNIHAIYQYGHEREYCPLPLCLLPNTSHWGKIALTGSLVVAVAFSCVQHCQ